MSRPVAVVTGGASGIGRATCARLAADGFALGVLDLDGDGAVEAAGAGGVGLSADISDPTRVDGAVTEMTERLGRIDLLVNNAGITGSPEATICHTTPVEEWERVFRVNVLGAFLVARAILPTMLAQQSGHIITIASVAGLVAFPGRCAYTASKGAALQFAKSLAVDYAPHGLRSNAVCPGFVDTPMTRWRLEDPALRAAVEARIPTGRVATSDDIADAVAALASDRLAYANGSALVVDGGWTAL